MAQSVPALPHRHLFTLKLDVDAASASQIGKTPDGRRSIAPIAGGSFEGERLKGLVLQGGADWVRFQSDGVMRIDVRLTLRTDDGALIYLAYEGRFIGGPDAMVKLAKGLTLDPGTYSLVTIARLECGSDRYAWLNTVIAVGIGQQSGFNPVYDFFGVG